MDFPSDKRYGFGFLKQDTPLNEEDEDLREFKISKTSSCGEGVPFLRSNAHQMLSFSSSQTPLSLPHYHFTSTPFDRNSGISMQGMRGPFTPSQWMELEHQALIYKYITSNVPIPSYLLNPIRKAFDSAGFSLLTSNALGWGGFRLGMSNSDPEPGRCRRTDGKKWRCSRDAVADQKYCDRHMNRGRHRSRKPVEPQSTSTPIPSITRGVVDQHTTVSKVTPSSPHKHQNAFQEFGVVCSDSLLNPLNRSSSLVGSKRYNDDENGNKSQLRQFMDEWPNIDRTQLSISIPGELEMGLGVGTLSDNRKTPISWESSSIGGPLGEALHTKQLNLIDGWGSASSPTGVLQRGPFASLSNSSAASSPRSSYCNGIINPSLPAL